MIDRQSDATLTLTLPDGSQRSVPAGTLPADVVKTIGERLLQAAVAVDVNGAIQDLMTPLRSGGIVPRAHGSRSAGTRRAPPLGRAHARHGRSSPPPGREDRVRSGHRRRLLLRLRGRRALHARGSRHIRERDAESRHRQVPIRARRSQSRASAEALRRRSAQVGAAVRARRRRDHLDVHRRPVHRSLSRAARPRHVAAQTLQADAHRWRVLARRLQASDAAAHLRHGVLQEGRSRCVPDPHRGSSQTRPPRARQSSSSCS